MAPSSFLILPHLAQVDPFVLFHQAVQFLAADTQSGGGARDIPLMRSEYTQHDAGVGRFRNRGRRTLLLRTTRTRAIGNRPKPLWKVNPAEDGLIAVERQQLPSQ
jgi:hypothetical protein